MFTYQNAADRFGQAFLDGSEGLSEGRKESLLTRRTYARPVNGWWTVLLVLALVGAALYSLKQGGPLRPCAVTSTTKLPSST